ncbi:MAG: [FeFe] hydrogenase H-cluster maturation GTPase HydF [Eubacterium sp.]|nr:[FeFe] hydrogenase H-cluster maturation GTPase HydF [Eubacterium sp.]
MGTTWNDTPSADRVHITFFGKMNSGKSSLINALAGQQISIVSDISGTTTDLVKKPMEIHGIGACVLVDTAGFDDTGVLGESRVALARQAAKQADLAVLVFDGNGQNSRFDEEKQWFCLLQKRDTPVILVLNKTDTNARAKELALQIGEQFGKTPLLASAAAKEGIEELKQALIAAAADKSTEQMRQITGGIVGKEDLVMLVMPQDIQAPKGRLILPQVQTLRELLDQKCITVCTSTDQFTHALAALKQPPKLIVTDSQVFRTIYEKKPKESMLTSFSVLFAAYKGDMDYFVQGAHLIETLTEQDQVLIAECCTHAPLDEDIGRVKLPRLLRKKVGEGLRIDIVSGTDFPQDLAKYSLIIQCGACMFNRKYVMSRVEAAKEQRVPMTNYGVAAAYLNGILDQVELPGQSRKEQQ